MTETTETTKWKPGFNTTKVYGSLEYRLKAPFQALEGGLGNFPKKLLSIINS